MMTPANEIARPWPIGGTVGLVFAGLWAVVGALALSGRLQPLILAAGLLLSVLLVVRLWRARRPDASTGLFRRRLYLAAVALEIAAIYAAAHLLPQHDLGAYLISVVGLVVGLHFIGLWRASGLDRFLWIAGCMSAVSIASMALPASGLLIATNVRQAVCGLGNAIVLWIFAGTAVQAPTRSAATKIG